MREKDPNPGLGSGGQKRKRKKTLTTKFSLPIWANEPSIFREFAIRIFQPESAGTGIDETLQSRHNVTDE